MIKKHKIILIFITILFSISNINLVNARIGGSHSVPGSSDSTNNGPPSSPGSLSCPGDGWTATCSASTAYYESSYIYPNMWDIHGNYISDAIDIEEKIENLGLNNILAGTYVGLNLYEEKQYYKHTTINSRGIQQYMNCRKWIIDIDWINCDEHGQNCTKDDNSYWDYKDHQKGTSCPAGYNSYTAPTFEYTDSCTDAYSKCKSNNKPSRITLNPSYTVEYPNSNDIDGGTYSPIEATTVSITPDDHDGNWYWHVGETRVFSYNMGKTCINAKTAEIFYNRDCHDDEYEITPGTTIIDENDITYWKYFIPLNANSKDDIKIKLNEIKETGKISGGICKSIITNHHNEYMNIIKPIKGIFTGNIDDDKTIVSQGCYWSVTVTIPIEQKFYNEVYDGNIFKGFRGFNFYYKPIEINKPFPNDLSNTSLWYDWNESDVKNPNLTESYNTTTYIADTSNHVNEIRNYKKTKTYTTIGEKYNTYTSWYNMNINGLSNFIGTLNNENIVYRRDGFNKDNIYPLGCGPWNVNPKKEDGITDNVFYQPECGKK